MGMGRGAGNAQTEYFLIENRNNYIIPGYDLEYLQYLLDQLK